MVGHNKGRTINIVALNKRVLLMKRNTKGETENKETMSVKTELVKQKLW